MVASANPRDFEMLESRLLFSIAAAPLLAAITNLPNAQSAQAATPLVPATAQAAPAAAIQYSAPITITQGGTYSGNWESTDPDVPAVTINTSDPVIIENSNIRSASDGIRCRWGNANLTVRNTNGYGLNPNVAGRSPGRFIDLQFFAKAVIENNYIEGNGGIYFNEYGGGGTDGNDITVRYNIAKNIDGRKSDGNGGWQITTGNYKQFVQLNNCHGLPGAEIAWNQIINEAGKSRVEDNISIHLSDGTAAKPILIHDNYIAGAYSQDPTNISFSGGGIMLSDGLVDDPAKVGGFVKAYNNQIISTSNYGIAISSGHDNEIYNNRIIMSGKTTAGAVIKPGDAGIYIRNPLSQATFKNNIAHDNQVGWARANGQRNDYSLQAATPAEQNLNNESIAGPITGDVEAAEFDLWTAKVKAANVTLGPKTPGGGGGGGGGVEVPALNSNASATHTLYLDFDGDVATSTPAYDGSVDDITEIWQRVSEKFSIFDLNVTTVKPASLKANESAQIIVGGGTALGGVGGNSPIGGFSSDNATGFTYPINLGDDPHFVAESISHEAGHLFGLMYHPGASGQTYDPGDMWTAPIMGSSYTAQRGLWANALAEDGTTQDDLAVLDSVLERRIDQFGIIEQTSDYDIYSFTTNGGEVHLKIDAPAGAMLDSVGALYDSSGTLLGQRDRRRVGESAVIYIAAGSYFVTVGSHGDYGDLGQYQLTGTDASGNINFTEVDDITLTPAATAQPAPKASIGTIVRVENSDNDVAVIDASSILNNAA